MHGPSQSTCSVFNNTMALSINLFNWSLQTLPHVLHECFCWFDILHEVKEVFHYLMANWIESHFIFVRIYINNLNSPCSGLHLCCNAAVLSSKASVVVRIIYRFFKGCLRSLTIATAVWIFIKLSTIHFIFYHIDNFGDECLWHIFEHIVIGRQLWVFLICQIVFYLFIAT